MYLLPPGPCAFVGMAFHGCEFEFYDCRAWLGGDYWSSMQAMAHELGHQLGAAHAGRVSEDGSIDKYGDPGDMMGYVNPGAAPCLNTPHAWQMGWIAVQQLNGSDLARGQTVVASLASQSLYDRSGLRIVPTWADDVDPLYLGFRTADGMDATLPPEVLGRVGVHTSAITGPEDAQPTLIQAALEGVRAGCLTCRAPCSHAIALPCLALASSHLVLHACAACHRPLPEWPPQPDPAIAPEFDG